MQLPVTESALTQLSTRLAAQTLSQVCILGEMRSAHCLRLAADMPSHLIALLVLVLLAASTSALSFSRVIPSDPVLYAITYHTSSSEYEPGCARTFTFFSTSNKRLLFNLTVERLRPTPLISAQFNGNDSHPYGQSINDYNYNAAYVPLHHNQSHTRHALLVRTQNATQLAMAPASPSQLFLAFDMTGQSDFAPITIDDLSLYPINVNETFGTEDPRIVYNPVDHRWWLWYTAVRSKPDVHADLWVASTHNITDPSAWVRHGPVCDDGRWSKSAALLLRPHNTSYLYFGDSQNGLGMWLATTSDLINYTIADGIWLPIRKKPYFDNDLVEGGPAPATLSTGDIFMLHNSAGDVPVNGSDVYGYHVSFVLLDADDPSQILFRSPISILSCEMGWEIGSAPWLGLTPNVVFTEGMRRYWEGGEDSFLFYYGGADSVVGAAVATFSWYEDGQEPMQHDGVRTD